MRRIVVPLILLALAVPTAGARSAAPAPTPTAVGVTATTFLITGRGYGHGVGMSQYGAYGFARNGYTYDQILAHYYPSTELGPAPVTSMRVLLAEGRPSVTISSSGPYTIRGAGTEAIEGPAGNLVLGPKLAVTVKGKRTLLTGPVVVAPRAGSLLRLGAQPYRGALHVRSDGRRLSVVNVLGLELYLQGVVPGEMPSDWHAEALKAQAVAARSYALAQRVAGKTFDVYADTRSQVYGGVAYEKPTTTAAVRATAGETVLHDGRPATTYFYSTSGGKTADSGEIFAQPRPYLVAVDDPYDSVSPYHRWGPVAVDAAKVARAFKAAAVTDVAVTPFASGRARSVVLRTALGDVPVRPTDVRFGLGLRSTWFRFGVLSVRRPVAPVVYGGTVRLTGTVRGVGGGVTLAERASSAWQPVRALPAGSFSIPVSPRATTVYRLADAAGRGPLLRVPVAPRVTFDGGAGRVTPALPGAAALLERQTGTTWAEAGRTEVAADGTYQLGVRLGSGAYRVRVPATRGYATGTSPVLTLG